MAAVSQPVVPSSPQISVAENADMSHSNNSPQNVSENSDHSPQGIKRKFDEHSIRTDSPRNKSPSASPVTATVCANCGTTTTPLWRRAPNGDTICNACGLYLKARNSVRPPWLKRHPMKKSTPPLNEGLDTEGTCPGDGRCDGTGGSSSCDGCPAYNQHQASRQSLVCSNCATTTTPLWRRDESGNTICNACGLYYKLHNVHRPVSMKKNVIKRRKRISTNPASNNTNSHTSENGEISSNGMVSERPQSNHACNHHDCHTNKPEIPPIEEFIVPLRRPHSEMYRSNRFNIDENREHQNRPATSSLHRDINGSSSATPSECFSSLPQKDSFHQQSVTPSANRTLPNTITSDSNFPSKVRNPPDLTEPSRHLTSHTAFQPEKHSETPLAQTHFDPRNSLSASNLAYLLNPERKAGLDIGLNNGQLPSLFPSIQPNSHNYRSTYQLLEAHRNELQREVNHLTMLLTRTTAILNGLDQILKIPENNSFDFEPHTSNSDRNDYSITLPRPPPYSNNNLKNSSNTQPPASQ